MQQVLDPALGRRILFERGKQGALGGVEARRNDGDSSTKTKTIETRACENGRGSRRLSEGTFDLTSGIITFLRFQRVDGGRKGDR